MVNWVAVAPAQSQLIEALRRIRVAIRLLVIGYLFIVLSMFGFYITEMEAFYYRGNYEKAHAAEVMGGSFFLAVLLIGVALIVVGVFAYLWRGTRALSKFDQRYSIASDLINIGYPWGLILLVAGLLLSRFTVGIPIMVVGASLLLMGHIGVILLAFNLYSAEKNTLYLVAGILFIPLSPIYAILLLLVALVADMLGIVGIVVSLLSPIAWIPMYMALGESIRKREPQPATQLQATMPQSIS